MENASVPSYQTVHAAYYSQVDVNLGLQRYINVVITQSQTGPCGRYRKCLCIYKDNSSTNMYIDVMCIHIHHYTLYQNIIILS